MDTWSLMPKNDYPMAFLESSNADMESQWNMMDILQDEDLQKIQNLISQIPEEDLHNATVPGGLDPLDTFYNQEQVNQEYFNEYNQEYCGYQQEYCNQQYANPVSPHSTQSTDVTIKNELPDQEDGSWWASSPSASSPSAPSPKGPSPAPGDANSRESLNIHTLDPLPHSPSSWEEYSFNFGPTTNSANCLPPSTSAPNGRTMTISRRRTDLPQNKHEAVRKLRRREQNRVAAQRCRTKKKIESEKTGQDFQELQKSHDRLQVEVEYLERERQKLERILQEHLKECNHASKGVNEC